MVNPVSGALMRRRGGTYEGVLGDGKHKQVGLSAGANFEANGPSPDRSKSPAVQRDGVHKTAGGADHSYLRRKAHRGAKAFWGLEAQGALEAQTFLLEAHPT